MALLAGAATVTERVRIEATVSVTPMHAAVHVAKQAATIDVLSDGRFVLGVGVGGRDEDYRAMERRSRGGTRGSTSRSRHAAGLGGRAAVRRCRAGRVPRRCSPVVRPCWRRAMGPKSMARAAALGRRCSPASTSPPTPPASTPDSASFETAWADAGRDGSPFLQTSFWFGLGDDAAERVRDYAYRYLRIFGDRAASAMADLVTVTAVPTLPRPARCDRADRLRRSHPRRDRIRSRRPRTGRRGGRRPLSDSSA